jgi:hypothetical protein
VIAFLLLILACEMALTASSWYNLALCLSSSGISSFDILIDFSDKRKSSIVGSFLCILTLKQVQIMSLCIIPYWSSLILFVFVVYTTTSFGFTFSLLLRVLLSLMVFSSFFGALTHPLFLLWPLYLSICMSFVGGENHDVGVSP